MPTSRHRTVRPGDCRQVEAILLVQRTIGSLFENYIESFNMEPTATPARANSAGSATPGRDVSLGKLHSRDRELRHNLKPTLAGLAAGSGLNDSMTRHPSTFRLLSPGMQPVGGGVLGLGDWKETISLFQIQNFPGRSDRSRLSGRAINSFKASSPAVP